MFLHKRKHTKNRNDLMAEKIDTLCLRNTFCPEMAIYLHMDRFFDILCISSVP